MTPVLSLYRLDAELSDLLAYRQERVDDAQSPASSEELEACDTAIRAYMEQLPRKVDGVAAILRYFDEQVEHADREIRRLRTRKAQIEENSQRLKDCAVAVLEKQPEPAKGCRKLTGTHSTLMLKANGGVQPLVISDPSMVPDELCVFDFSLTAAEWDEVRRLILRGLATGMELSRPLSASKRPSNALIREALIQPCAMCAGTGGRAGVYECQTCGGSGRSSVPGAHLEPRGRSVVVK